MTTMSSNTSLLRTGNQTWRNLSYQKVRGDSYVKHCQAFNEVNLHCCKLHCNHSFYLFLRLKYNFYMPAGGYANPGGSCFQEINTTKSDWKPNKLASRQTQDSEEAER